MSLAGRGEGNLPTPHGRGDAARMNTPRSVLITGGNRGIGLALVEAMARNGYRVWLGSRDAAAGAREVERLQQDGHTVHLLPIDLARPSSVAAAIETMADTPIDVLINNAGILHDEPELLALSDDEIDTSVRVHVTGPLQLIRGLTDGMRARRYGRIVNMSSGWGSFAEGLGGPGAYGITKAAMNALTVKLAADLPATIKVNAMCPGWVRTRMGGPNASRSPEESTDTAIWLATLPDGGPTGGFFRDRRPIRW
jgi:NAD(P)-dependent dehydrogenase (short-subunit alcohol dehydrogenase family)